MFIKQRESIAGLVLLIGALQVHAASVINIETESSENGESKGTQTQIVTIDDKKVRLDYLGAESQKSSTTPYLLTLNAGKSWILGDQRDGQFYCAKVDMKGFFRDIGKIVSRIDTLANPKFSDMKVELLVDEPGPEILGYATTHIRIQTTAKLKASVMMKKFEYGMNKVDDIWYTKDREVHPAKQRWIEALTHSGYEQLDQLSSGLRSKVGGPILIHNTEMEVTNYRENKVETYGKKVRVVSIKELESSEVPVGTFTKPDCKKIDKNQTKDAAKSMFKEGKLTL
jgi:hypothetical protein